jgi:hypothetical protein
MDNVDKNERIIRSNIQVGGKFNPQILPKTCDEPNMRTFKTSFCLLDWCK